MASKQQGFANQAGVRGKLCTPKCVADDRDRGCTFVVVLGTQHAPGVGCNTKHCEVVAGDEAGAEGLRGFFARTMNAHRI